MKMTVRQLKPDEVFISQSRFARGDFNVTAATNGNIWITLGNGLDVCLSPTLVDTLLKEIKKVRQAQA